MLVLQVHEAHGRLARIVGAQVFQHQLQQQIYLQHLLHHKSFSGAWNPGCGVGQRVYHPLKVVLTDRIRQG